MADNKVKQPNEKFLHILKKSNQKMFEYKLFGMFGYYLNETPTIVNLKTHCAHLVQQGIT